MTTTGITTITPAELAAKAATGPVDLIDVRTPAEFAEVHAAPARNVPLDQLDPATVAANRKAPADQPLYVICKSGARGRKACDAFERAGLTSVVNVEGGTDAWVQAGLPVVRGSRKALSLERQARITAGGIALVGSLLALTVHPWFAAIPAFIGAGLVFAGVTDTCGMAMLLAKMPWNRLAPGCRVG